MKSRNRSGRSLSAQEIRMGPGQALKEIDGLSRDSNMNADDIEEGKKETKKNLSKDFPLLYTSSDGAEASHCG